MITWPQVWQRIAGGVKLVEDQRVSIVNTFLPQELVLQSDGIPYDSFNAPTFTAIEATVRAAFASAVTAGGALISPGLVELATLTGKPETQVGAILPRVYDWMALNSGAYKNPPRVMSRQFSRGAWTAGAGNVGNGTLLRLNVDQYGLPIESGFAEIKNFRCLFDAQSGTKIGQEQFEVWGLPFRDNLTRYAAGFGSGLSLSAGAGGLHGITGDDTQTLLSNPSFSDFSGAGAGFLLTGWTINTPFGGNASISTIAADIYRPCSIESTPGALLVATSATPMVIQQLLSTRSGSLSVDLPYMFQLAVNRSNYAGTGTVLCEIVNAVTGAVALTWNIVLAAQVGYQLLRPAIDLNLYFKNFDINNLAFRITITVSAGSVLIDDYCASTWTNIDGTLFWLIGGSTPFKYLDTGTVTDTEVGAKIQRTMARTYLWSLPSAVLPGPPATAPVPTTGAAGAGPTAGVHFYAISARNAAGQDSGIGLTSFPLYSDGATTTNITLPLGPVGTVSRDVYMTKANDPAQNFYFVGTIADNVSAGPYNIAVLDAALLLLNGVIADPA